MLANELLELAHETSSDKRRVLLRQITDLFFDGVSERNVSESALFEEVVMRVVRDVDMSGRIDLSERVADEVAAPRGLVRSLATDDINVARPILQRSRVLEDTDLVAIADTAGDEHLQAITQRSTVSEIVTDVLVRRGSQLVVRSVARNEGARFSNFGFGELVRRAKGDEALQMGLATRADLPEAVVQELAPLLSEKLKSTLAAMGVSMPDAMAPPLVDAVHTRLAATFREREAEARTVAQIVTDLKAGTTTLEREIPALARNDRAYDIATVVAGLAGIDHATAMKALTGPNDEPLIVLFRSLDTPWAVFELVLQLRAKRLRQNYVRSQTMARTYQEMEMATAQRVLRFLQVRRAAEGGGRAA